MKSTKRITLLSIFTSLALITFLIESHFPPLFLPGAKMGLSNIFTLMCLVILTPLDAFILIFVRTFLASLFFGGINTLIFSLPAGVISVALSSVLTYAFPKISLVAISVASAVLHNLVQNLIYVWVTGLKLMLGYMPYLALIGILAGVIVGVCAQLVIKAIPISAFTRFYDSAGKK